MSPHAKLAETRCATSRLALTRAFARTRYSMSRHSLVGYRNSCVFVKYGEKKNSNRARIKFLVQDLGMEKFRELVLEERKNLPPDPRWAEYLEAAVAQFKETPLKPAGERPLLGSADFQRWLK